jgi:hypothetical protein
MNEEQGVVMGALFRLRAGANEPDFKKACVAFYQHLVDMEFATGYRIMRRQPRDGLGEGLPSFTYYAELISSDLESDAAGYEYVKQQGDLVHPLHVAMRSFTEPGSADFFLAVSF